MIIEVVHSKIHVFDIVVKQHRDLMKYSSGDMLRRQRRERDHVVSRWRTDRTEAETPEVHGESDEVMSKRREGG